MTSLYALALGAALFAAEPPGASPSSSPPTSPAGQITPSATPSGPNSSPSPSVTPSPAPTPNYGYRFVPKPPVALLAGSPQIFEIDLNDRRLHDTISIRVLTNEVVTRVVSRSNGQSGDLQQVAPGAFTATHKLPKIPFFARGFTIDLEFIATTADGRSTSVKVPVQLG